MSGRWPFTAEKIATRLNLIEPYIIRRRAVLPNFRFLPLPAAIVDAPICADPDAWEEIESESYWGHSDLNFILKSHFVVPSEWNPDNIALHLPLGVMGDIFNHPEALVHVDKQPIGSADRYHHTIPLAPSLSDGKRHMLSLHGWTGHASWPFEADSKAKLFMGQPAIVERDPALLKFHGMAKAALDAARILEHDSPECMGLLEALDKAFLALDTRDPIGDALYESVAEASRLLQSGIAAAGKPLDVTLHGIGHAHMDIAYLWPVSQIRLKNARTYTNVLRLMDEDPDYRFSHSQPQLYDYTARDYPALFDEIKARVAQGRWEIMGGMWVEPDLNIPGPEALVRQLMLGRTYYRDTFDGEETPVLWLPDTFGFPGQIPQLMRHAGLKWFVTNKLNWNQKNKVPSTTHYWEGIDGSQVLAHILTTPRAVQYLPFPTNYKSDLSAAEVLGTWTYSTANNSVRDLPICYGYGDGGGGPTEDLLAKARAYQTMPGMPELRMSSVRELFDELEKTATELPVWRGEHYMEGHRGVLTSQGWIKRANRKAEWALHEAEALCAMADVAADLEEAWQLLCLNQFHDILTGTSVPEVFEDARRDFERIMHLAEGVAEFACSKLVSSEPVVANTSPVTGPRLAFVPGMELENGQVVSGGCLAFFDNVMPYCLTPLTQASATIDASTCKVDEIGAVLENGTLRVSIASNGQVTEVYDKVAQRSALAAGASGNVLQSFEDRPICWDAWDIDPFIEDRQDDIETPCTIEIIEDGPLRASVKISRKWRRSSIVQTVRLAAQSSRLDFETEIDWHEKHTLLKVAFPTCIEAPIAQFDIQWGFIERSTSRNSDFDAARFEVAAQKWAQLSEPGYSVAVLNDCKYGCDVHGNTIRLTLIKSATYPDPKADQGTHRFTYSLLSNSVGERAALDRSAYDLNAPLRVIDAGQNMRSNFAPLIKCAAPNVIIETVKPSANGRGIIVRLFEAHATDTEATLTFAYPLAEVHRVNVMEDIIGPAIFHNCDIPLKLGSFEIVSLFIIFDTAVSR